jgi:hypothetical protein
VVGKILANSSATYGFNAQTEEYVDMLQAGIVDPAKVVRAALQGAASVAGLLVTTEAMISDAPRSEAPAMPGGGGGMGGMGGIPSSIDQGSPFGAALFNLEGRFVCLDGVAGFAAGPNSVTARTNYGLSGLWIAGAWRPDGSARG